MTQLILLEDEPTLRQELQEFLSSQGYALTCAATLQEFEQCFDPQLHRIAIIDLGLPDGNGLQLIQRLREHGQQIGIIIFSARGSSSDKIHGLEAGADHYLGKECDLDELAATLSALSRRLEQHYGQTNWLLERQARLLSPPDCARPIPLTEQETLLLLCLMQQNGTHVSRRQLVEALGMDYLNYDPQRLDTQMSRLRRKVQADSGQALPVKTARNQGYCFFRPALVRD